MRKVLAGSMIFGLLSALLSASSPPSGCGTRSERQRAERFLHRRSSQVRAKDILRFAASTLPDVGEIAILDDSGGVVDPRNPLDLDQKTLIFTPSAAGYQFAVTGNSYDSAAAAAGAALSGFGDQDTRAIALPFAFPFFGASYRQVYVNSDGNLTFTSGDIETDWSFGRFSSGFPRIAPLFTDLDPSVSPRPVTVFSDSAHVVITWPGVTLYSQYGVLQPQTFQARLFPDGRIELAYNGVTAPSAVVGISPGNSPGAGTLVSFSSGSSRTFTVPIGEVFAGTDSVDVIAAAQKFYQTHEDSYDYLVFYNAEGIAADAGVVAWEITVRNNRTGYGDSIVDYGQELGSRQRLQSVMNMGPINQYPVNPNGIVPARYLTGDTPISLLAHEAGHLFIAYATVPDENDPNASPMLSTPDLAHWSFSFNSEASVNGGNLIEDRGAAASVRFLTTGTVSQYAPLDQYLMGFRPPEQVEPTFLVTNSTAGASSRLPQLGVGFNGTREDIRVEDLIAAVGRRTPDSTVAQRHFRFAFILIVPAGTAPSADLIAQLETYRENFEPFYAEAASNLASADVSLKRALHFSAFPALGVLAGASAQASVTLEQPAAAALTVTIQTPNGVLSAPAAVQIPAGATTVQFPLTGAQPGVEDLTATPSDPAFETAFERVQVLPSPTTLTLSLVSQSPVAARVVDVNGLPYPSVRVSAASNAGPVQPSEAVSDSKGLVTFQWTPSGAGQLVLTIAGAPNSALTIAGSGIPAISPNGVVNAASFVPGLAPGEIGSIFGANFASGAEVQIGGVNAQVLSVNGGQINFIAPSALAPGTASVVVATSAGASAPAGVSVTAVLPGIFYDQGSGLGAVLPQPAAAGDPVEIYATGLGSEQVAQVTIGGLTAQVLYAGAAPGFPGLNQINAVVPAGLTSGSQTLQVTVAGVQSNTVRIQVQ